MRPPTLPIGPKYSAQEQKKRDTFANQIILRRQPLGSLLFARHSSLCLFFVFFVSLSLRQHINISDIGS